MTEDAPARTGRCATASIAGRPCGSRHDARRPLRRDGPLHDHLVLTDRAWLVRFTQDPTPLQSLDGTIPTFTGALDQALSGDFATLRPEREKTDADIERWVATLTDEGLARPLAYRSVAYARDYAHPLWWAVSHFFNHQTHHRGQTTTLLHQLGVDPGTTDLVDLLRNESP